MRALRTESCSHIASVFFQICWPSFHERGQKAPPDSVPSTGVNAFRSLTHQHSMMRIAVSRCSALADVLSSVVVGIGRGLRRDDQPWSRSVDQTPACWKLATPHRSAVTRPVFTNRNGRETAIVEIGSQHGLAK